jgi:hypothetical protein
MRALQLLFFLAGITLMNACTEERLTLVVEEIRAAPGEQTCLQVTVEDFENILTMQYSIAWDNEVLRFVEVKDFGLPGLSAQNFGRPPSHPDRLTLSWFEPSLSSVTVPDNTAIFSVCFEVVGSSGQESPVMITDNPTIIEIANADEEVMDPSLLGGSVLVE